MSDMENVLETERQFLTEQANSLYNVNEINTDVEADFKIKLKALLKTLNIQGTFEKGCRFKARLTLNPNFS